MIEIEPTNTTWYILISALVVSLAMILFLILLIRQIFIKRTIGTVLLTIFYFLLAIGEITNTAGLWYFSFVIDSLKISAYLELNFVLCYGLGYIFLYYFLTKYFLDDNDLIKSLILILLTAVISIICSFMFGEIYFNSNNGIFTTELFMEGTNITQVLPSFISGIIVFLPIFLLIHLRIIVKIIILQKDISSKEGKYGFLFIIFSLICFVIAAIFASIFVIPGIGQHSLTIILIHTFRIVFTQLGLILGYFGWLYPEWLRNSIGKTTT
ncbi:MAG: hypothetical protein ACFFDW_11090 [Candidatus Thorarchaeota archaeon]